MARQHHQNGRSADVRDEVHSTAASLANRHPGLDPAQTAEALRTLIDAINDVAPSVEPLTPCFAYNILDDAIEVLGTIPLKVDAFVPILWGVMPVFTFAGREASHAPGENL